MDEVLAARRAVQTQAQHLAQQQNASVRRGMIRYVVLIVDCSSAMDLSNDGAFQPDRWSVVVAKVTDFIREFLKQNPLSYLQLVSMQNCKAIKLTDFSGIETAHCYALAALKPNGEASLQIALAEACSSLRLAPSYSTKEILIVHSTITTCDPSDIFATIAVAKQLRARCSVVSISCEVCSCVRECVHACVRSLVGGWCWVQLTCLTVVLLSHMHVGLTLSSPRRARRVFVVVSGDTYLVSRNLGSGRGF